MTDTHPDGIKDHIVAQTATLFEVHDNVSRVIRDLTLPLADYATRMRSRRARPLISNRCSDCTSTKK